MKLNLRFFLFFYYTYLIDATGKINRKGDLIISLSSNNIDFESFQKENVCISENGVVKIEVRKFISLFKKEKKLLKEEIADLLKIYDISVRSIDFSYPFVIVNTSRFTIDITKVKSVSPAFENAKILSFYKFKFNIGDINEL